MPTTQQTGFKLAQSVISNGAITGNEWTDPENLLLVDGEVSESGPSAGEASDVVIGNFNSDLPADAVVEGIELKIFGYRGAQTAPPITLTPYALDNTSGEDIYWPYSPALEDLTQELEEYLLGSPTYLFDTTWTVDQINNFKLQLVANGDTYIDAALLNVYYHVPDEPEPPTPVGDRCENCNSPIQAQPFYLALPFLATDTKCYLQSFNYPDGSPIQLTDLGDCGGYIDLVFDEGKAKKQGSNFEENAFCGLWQVLPNGTVELDFVTLENRGRAFHTPYDHDPDLLSDHDANTKVIISNNGHFYDRFRRKCSEPTAVYNEIVEVGPDPDTWVLANTPIVGTVRVYANGQRLYLGEGYTISGDTITTDQSWDPGLILADYNYE